MLSTILLFASGEGYREGYLAGFSVDISQVPISFQETLYWGYLANAAYGLLFLLTLAFAVITLGGFMMSSGWLLSTLQQRYPRLRPKLLAEKPPAKRRSPGLIMTISGLGIMLGIYVLAFGYLVPKKSTDHGRAQAESTMNAFLKDELKAAETYKLRCVHMKWGNDDNGASRDIYAYQLFCHDKLCKVYEPSTRTFPTVFLEGIRTIVPRSVTASSLASCVASPTQ